jgi:hypothetical protein
METAGSREFILMNVGGSLELIQPEAMLWTQDGLAGRPDLGRKEAVDPRAALARSTREFQADEANP